MINTVGAVSGAVLSFLVISTGSYLAPVVTAMEMTRIERVDGVITGRVTGRKIKDCAVVGGSFVGWQKINSVWRETKFQFVDDPSPDSSNPSGWARQGFGLWQWQDVSPDATDLRLSLQHSCSDRLRVTAIDFPLDE